MRISVTVNQRIAIYKGNTLIALLDEMGFPIITPRFFDLSNTEHHMILNPQHHT